MYQARRKHILGIGAAGGDFGGEVDPNNPDVVPGNEQVTSKLVTDWPDTTDIGGWWKSVMGESAGFKPSVDASKAKTSSGSSNATLIYGGVGLLVAFALFSGRRR